MNIMISHISCTNYSIRLNVSANYCRASAATIFVFALLFENHFASRHFLTFVECFFLLLRLLLAISICRQLFVLGIFSIVVSRREFEIGINNVWNWTMLNHLVNNKIICNLQMKSLSTTRNIYAHRWALFGVSSIVVRLRLWCRSCILRVTNTQRAATVNCRCAVDCKLSVHKTQSPAMTALLIETTVRLQS